MRIHKKLHKLLSQTINEDSKFKTAHSTGMLADVVLDDGGKLTPIASGVLEEHAELIAYLLDNGYLIADVLGAFVDLMDGNNEHDIRRATGLDEGRCRQIYELFGKVMKEGS